MAIDEVWVGRFKNNDKVILFDPEMNSAESELVKLFVKEDEVIREFQRKSIRTEVERVRNKTTVVITESSYNRWKDRQTVERLKKSMPRRGKPKDIFCFCGLQVDPINGRKCKVCGWLICPDCHCGCDYRGQ